MSKRAKVNMESVQSFLEAVNTVTGYSGKLEQGINCLEELIEQIPMFVNSLKGDIDHLSNAQELLADKIKDLEELLSEYTSQLDDLEENLSDLESELRDTPEYIHETDDAGDSFEKSNPEYDDIKFQISVVEGEIETVRNHMYGCQSRMEHAFSVNNQITFHKDTINGVISSLEEKKNVCMQLRIEMSDIKRQNHEQGTCAVETLKKIQEIIKDYLKVKMVYETATVTGNNYNNETAGVNLNINIQRNTMFQNRTVSQSPKIKRADFSKQEIIEHAISFDNNDRVISYDGKSFGGKYNSYEERLSHTSSDENPIFGYYEGTRGESKFIPSSRTVEGIIVNDIIKQYGLDGIDYRNAEPDFDPCAEAVVKIPAMTENRENYQNKNGEYCLGNATQADIELAKVWNNENRQGRNDWSASEVREYRKANKLTWHEKCDTETMLLVRSEINLFFKHSGGCSECKARDAEKVDGGEYDE